MFSSYKTWKGKNKDFVIQKNFFAIPILKPTSMPMLMPKYQCRDFQIAHSYFVGDRKTNLWKDPLEKDERHLILSNKEYSLYLLS